MKTITTILAISLFTWLPTSFDGNPTLEEIPLDIENHEYISELEEATYENIYLDEYSLDIENHRYLEELKSVDGAITLEEIPLHLQYNEIEDIYELEEVILDEIPLNISEY